MTGAPSTSSSTQSKAASIAAYRAAPRDASRPVALIGFQEQSNLGLGYLSAVLKQHGYSVDVFDFDQDPDVIVAHARASAPVLIGFSLIFQFYVERFARLVRMLRDAGVSCHFTMGGHFPSLSHAHAFQLIPEMDSIVLFEGELTLLELTDALSLGAEWRGVQGLAFRDGPKIVANPMRPLLHDLDELPYPDRNDIRPMTMVGRKAMPIVASRGCIRTCSFCSIHVYYRTAPGKIVRTRKPRAVVEEMRALYDERQIRVFLFQDDDFPLYGPKWRKWANDFVDELYVQNLVGNVIWKINCRADAVEAELMARMRDAGLCVVYMGLESGSENGLETLNKEITVEENLKAVATLKSLGLHFEYGFMLFDPSSTFETIADSLKFLRTIVGDGTAPASFCRMVPYDGTPIKETLIRQGRFKGDIVNPDYDFLDPRIEELFHALNRMVHVSGWIHGVEALTPQLQCANTEIAVLERLFPPLPGFRAYKKAIRDVTRVANAKLFEVVENTLAAFREDRDPAWTAELVREETVGYRERLFKLHDAFFDANRGALIEALARDYPEAQVA
ncbi:MAG TPA: radical SAM protein [Roseiarcus sp.]|nr:radical SAM protein [Roseiarcus sp.]